jgi:hypothetical protein
MKYSRQFLLLQQQHSDEDDQGWQKNGCFKGGLLQRREAQPPEGEDEEEEDEEEEEEERWLAASKCKRAANGRGQEGPRKISNGLLEPFTPLTPATPSLPLSRESSSNVLRRESSKGKLSSGAFLDTGSQRNPSLELKGGWIVLVDASKPFKLS